MQENERQLINKLFEKITEVAAQSGPRDSQTEALIDQKMQGVGGGILIANAGMVLADSMFSGSLDDLDLLDANDAGYEEAALDMLDDADDFGGFDNFDF